MIVQVDGFGIIQVVVVSRLPSTQGSKEYGGSVQAGGRWNLARVVKKYKMMMGAFLAPVVKILNIVWLPTTVTPTQIYYHCHPPLTSPTRPAGNLVCLLPWLSNEIIIDIDISSFDCSFIFI